MEISTPSTTSARAKYAVPLLAALTIVVMASMLSVETAAAPPKTQCSGTPFAYSIIESTVNVDEDFPEKGGVEVFAMARGATTVIDCQDHDHVLHGQTLDVRQAGRLVFTAAIIAPTGTVIGRTRGSTGTQAADVDSNGKAVAITSFKSPTRGTGQCDAGGTCTLSVEINASTGNGGQLTMTEVITLDLNAGQVTSISCVDWGYRAGAD